MNASTISFRAGMTRDLRRRGLRGNTVGVSFDGATLAIVGDTFGRIEIGLERLTRVRVGQAQGRSTRFHQMLIWSAGTGAPLIVGTSEPTERGRFAALARAVCEAVANGGHADRVEVGESKFRAGFMLLLFAVQSACFATLAHHVLGESEEALGASHAVAVSVPIAFLFGALGAMWWAWTRQWPRRVRSGSDLDRVLPRVG